MTTIGGAVAITAAEFGGLVAAVEGASMGAFALGMLLLLP